MPPSVVHSNYMKSIFRRLTPCVALALLAGAGVPSMAASELFCPSAFYTRRTAVPSVSEQLKPLADLLASGEGNYDSINRGYAGDTPGGMTGYAGRHLTTYTVAEVMSLQSGGLYAVGRYQFIPTTLRFAVNASGVNGSDAFDEATQDRLMAALIAYKRPAILSYLQGSHNNLSYVLDELAREWASVEYRNGYSYYSYGGNRAKISRAQAAKVLQEVKSTWQDAGQLP